MASFGQLGAVPSGLTVDELAGTVSKISKELNWLLRNLDDLNISSLSANKITAGTIDADVINVINLDAANIKADTVMADVDLIIGMGDAVFKADDNGIYLGNADFVLAPFSVDMLGNLYAVSATIQGDITSSTITGGTLTGAVVATDFIGNDRIELSGNGLLSLNESDIKEGICIETGSWGFSSLNWYDDSGSAFPVAGIAYDTLGNFNILSNPGINIQIWSDEDLILKADEYILPQGIVNCANASFINLSDGSGYYATESWVESNFSPLGHSHSYADSSDISAAITAHEAAYH